jgi:hypothetical protein
VLVRDRNTRLRSIILKKGNNQHKHYHYWKNPNPSNMARALLLYYRDVFGGNRVQRRRASLKRTNSKAKSVFIFIFIAIGRESHLLVGRKPVCCEPFHLPRSISFAMLPGTCR